MSAPGFVVTRVFADTEGESHFDEVTFDLQDAGEIGWLSVDTPAEAVVFRHNEPGYDYAWHCAPARQLVVLLDGRIAIEVSDGEKREFSGGDVILVEDTTGRGHRTWNVDRRPRRSLFVKLGS